MLIKTKKKEMLKIASKILDFNLNERKKEDKRFKNLNTQSNA